MPAKQSPGLGLNYGWDLGEAGWKPGTDDNWIALSAWLGGKITDAVATPAVTTDGTIYLVLGGTGPFAGQDNKIAVRINGAWKFFAPGIGQRMFYPAGNMTIVWDGTTWAPSGSVTGTIQRSNPGSWSFPTATYTKVPLYSGSSNSDAVGFDTGGNTDANVFKDGFFLVTGIIRPLHTGTNAIPVNTSFAMGVGKTLGDADEVVWGVSPPSAIPFTLQVTRVIEATAGEKIFMFARHAATGAVAVSKAKLEIRYLGKP